MNECQCIKSFPTLSLDGVGGQLQAPTALPPRKKKLRKPGSLGLLGHFVGHKYRKAGVNGQTATAYTYFHQ